MMRFFYIIILLFTVHCCKAQDSIQIRFQAYANGRMMFIDDSLHTNAFGERYTVSKLKYYISNVHLITDKKTDLTPNVFLINTDEELQKHFMIPKPSNKVKGIEFTLGVDSALNNSGAQSGALDPLNDMFWTWNSGYVMFKLEGKSSSSKADLNRIEQHIGGYKNEYRTMRKMYIPLNYNYLSELKMIVLKLDLDKYWKGVNEIRITETPVIAVPGAEAKKAADNFPGMFSIESTCCYEQ